MAMISDPEQKLYAALRRQCKSIFFVQLMNRFGESGAFDTIIELIEKKETGLDKVQILVNLVTEASLIYHKQFIDTFC